MNEVKLTPSEMFVASMIGSMRQCSNLRDGRADAHGCTEDAGWQSHIMGACGEAAVAKYRNQWWSGNLGNLRADDVGELQVRTRSRDHYDLIVHDSDPGNRAFVLVTGTGPVFRLHGWIMGRDAKQPQYWSDPAGGRPAYFVPQSALRAMEELK